MGNKIHHYSYKEHIKNSKCAKFGREMLKNAENIALQNLQIFYTFLLQAEICTTFKPKPEIMRFRSVYVNLRRHIQTLNQATCKLYKVI